MSVEFKDSNVTRRKISKKDISFVGLLKKYNLAKTDAQANLILTVIALVFFLASLFIIYRTFFPNFFANDAPVVQPPQAQEAAPIVN